MTSPLTPRGQFWFGQSYRRAADEILSLGNDWRHKDAPARTLYNHAIELFLKAFLLLRGLEESDLRKIGHRYRALASECAARGLAIDLNDLEVLSLIDRSYPRSRYLENLRVVWATLDQLAITAEIIDKDVGQALAQAGVSLPIFCGSVQRKAEDR